MIKELEKQYNEKNAEFLATNSRKQNKKYNQLFFEMQELMKAIKNEKQKFTLTDENAYT